MKRAPLIVSFILFLALCASAAYWVLQFIQPKSRPVLAPDITAPVSAPLSAAASLLGGNAQPASVSEFHLTGIIWARPAGESLALIATSSKPAQALRAGQSVANDVSVQEVHRDHVLLMENGNSKRLELATDSGKQLHVHASAPTHP